MHATVASYQPTTHIVPTHAKEKLINIGHLVYEVIPQIPIINRYSNIGADIDVQLMIGAPLVLMTWKRCSQIQS